MYQKMAIYISGNHVSRNCLSWGPLAYKTYYVQLWYEDDVKGRERGRVVHAFTI